MADRSEMLEDLRALRRAPERLKGLEPMLRSLVQSAEIDRRKSLRSFHLLRAHYYRQARDLAADLLQQAEEAVP